MYATTRVGVGASLALSRALDVDLAYQFVRGHRRQVHETILDDLMVFEGSYATRSQVIGLPCAGRYRKSARPACCSSRRRCA